MGWFDYGYPPGDPRHQDWLATFKTNNKHMNQIHEIAAMQDKEYVDSFTGTVFDTKEIEKKAPKKGVFYVGKVIDGTTEVSVVSFGPKLTLYEGKVCDFSGKGMVKATDEYNGEITTKVLIFGNECTILPIGDAVEGQEPSSPPPASTPKGDDSAPKGGKVERHQGSGRFAGMVRGDSCGNGMTNATAVLISIYGADLKAAITEKKFQRMLAEVAGAYVKVGLFLADGNLDGYPEAGSELQDDLGDETPETPEPPTDLGEDAPADDDDDQDDVPF